MTVLALREHPTPDPRTLDEPARSFATALSAHYAIKREIGRGGMGVVYLARDKRLDRLVAIKTLPPHLATDSSIRERFLRETRTAGAMSHPNIVPIHGADEIDGHVFFVMGFIDGESLAARIRREGPLEPMDLARCLRDVTSALAHAHQRGIIHRDIKAENILLDEHGGRALVTDFGIARVAESAPITQTGQLLGTVYYVSPEQVSGDPIDARSDLYSLGVVGYYALTGRFPFESDVASAVLVAHVTKTPKPLGALAPNAPAALTSIIERCMSRAPEHRYGSAEALGAALDAALPEIGRASSAPATPRLISDTEAHSVWRRAAELHASTGIVPRPEAVPEARDAHADATRTSGHRVDDVRAAAAEAGIPERYVEHALVERGLLRTAPSTARATAVIQPRPLLRKPSVIAGVPLVVAAEVVVEGEVDSHVFESMVTSCRDATGKVGHVAARARELAWSAAYFTGERVDVSVIPADGRTRIRVTRERHVTARSPVIISGGIMGGLGGILTANLLLYEAGAAIATAGLAGIVVFGLSTVFGRWITRNAHERESGLIDLLVRDLAAKARDSIDGTARTPANGILPR